MCDSFSQNARRAFQQKFEILDLNLFSSKTDRRDAFNRIFRRDISDKMLDMIFQETVGRNIFMQNVFMT